MNKLVKKEKGFTIIEVVLVLAIAGLIFLTVFLALPALQRSQKDTQRRTDINRAAAALQTFQSNNNGQVPKQTGWGTFVSSYLAPFNAPSGAAYTISSPATIPTTAVDTIAATVDTVYFFTGRACPVTTDLALVTQTGAAAIITQLEGGGAYCADNV